MFKGGKKLFLIFFALSILVLPVFVLAQDIGSNYAANLGLAGAAEGDLRDMIVSIVRYFLTFVGIVAVLIVMYGGFLWMSSNGQPERIQKAKKTLIGAVIGLIIVLAAFAIVEFVINITNDAIIGEACSPTDPPRPCGCQGMGVQICQAGGTWGACSADCDYGGGESCCSFGCAADCTIPPEFYINSYVPPNGALDVVRNVRVRFNFNRRPIASTVDNATFEVVGSAGTSGTITASGNSVFFRPNGDCGTNPCGLTNSCFAVGETVTVTAHNGAAGILSVGDVLLDCPGGGLDCSMSFTVGSSIDCQDPELNLDITQVCAMANNEFHANASDDNGITQIEFFVDGLSVPDLDNPMIAPGSLSYNTRDDLPTAVTFDASALEGDTIAIRATAEDVAARQGSQTRNYRVNPGHCCNGVLDTALGEEGVDCGGPCAGCAGAACGVSMADDCAITGESCSANNSLCASGLCSCIDPVANGLGFDCSDRGYGFASGDCCLCQEAPIVDWVTPQGGFCRDSAGNPSDIACLADSDCAGLPGLCDLNTANVASGNLATIGGRYFGPYGPGCSVEFENAGAWISAQLAQDVNANCTDSWTPTQIVVEVPAGLAGAFNPTMVRVTNDYGFSDTSGADGRGAIIDIIENNIVRPGLCLLSPDSGRMNQTLTYQGVNLGGATAFFGNLSSNSPALNPIFAADSGTAQVPNIATGRTSTFTVNGATGAASNFLQFSKLAEIADGPYISSFEPIAGAPGQYVTIYGNGFGRRQATSRVFFGDNLSGIEADYNFPEQCADSVWTDNQVIVKVPSTVNGDYIITMDLNSGEIASTSALTPSQFTINDALPLSPSLCRISPVMGPNLSPLTLWGEYFGVATPGLVRFHLNHDQAGGVWAVDGLADRIDTLIHAEAVSGPVRVVQGGEISNSMNLNVGNCTQAPDPDAACGAQICCGVGTFNEGRCAPTVNDCYQDIEASVLEWDFTTAAVLYAGPGEPCSTPDPMSCNDAYPICDPADGTLCTEDPSGTGPCTCEYDTSDSCQGLAESTGSCSTGPCPNASGNCSPYPGGVESPVGTSCSDADCNAVYPVDCAGACSYDAGINRCVDLNQAGGPDCSLASTTFRDVIGNRVTATCKNFSGSGRWHIRTSLSCPSTDWTMLLGECVNTVLTCDICNAGFTCQNDNDGDFEGICAIGGAVCPSGSACDTTSPSPVCIQADSASCECCCEIGFDTRDCCSYDSGGGVMVPLTCAGECGSDRISDTDTWGYCSGCSAAPDPDAACNCSGSSGRYCDTAAAGGSGVCRDCAQLSTASDCSDHASYCCVDAESSERCRGGEGVFEGGSLSPASGGYGPMSTDNGDPALAYCAYFDCEADYTCNNENYIIASSSARVFRATSTCENTCSSLAGASLGLSCSGTSPGYLATDCDPSVCPAPFSCLLPTGAAGFFSAAVDSCGICCCSDNSQCTAVSAGLYCQPDTAPCDGPNRGLCCGCSADADCAAGIPDAAGCGTDTCCHARPGVVDTIPADNEADVCRNAAVQVEFNQPMDASSFRGNVILAGDYGSETCPAGLEYLALGGRTESGLLARIWGKIRYWLDKILPTRLVKAYTDPNIGFVHNYCAVPATVNGRNDSVSGHGFMEIYPRSLLDPDRLYYVILKGDIDLNSSQGIRNSWGIGLNAEPFSPSAGNNTFNGIDYSRAMVWSFTTLSDQAENNGVCEVARVDIAPRSYLFQNLSPDPGENDTAPDSATFDIANDNDKQFIAYARGSDNSILSPVPAYDWNWVWNINNTAVAALVTPAGIAPSRELVRTVDGVTDAKTYVSAEVQFTAVPPGLPSAPISGRADVYVFFCTNPWPPVVNGAWSPWRDNSLNCLAGTGPCPNMNYEIYYCRDEGNFGTFDDLPAIVSTSTIIRGTSLKCDDGNGNCLGSGVGDPCSDGSGHCVYDIFKEAFFFRELTPTSTVALELGNGLVGETATATWENIALLDSAITGYRLYWGQDSEEYSDFARIDTSGLSDNPAVSCTAAADLSCTIAGLENETTYYFNLSSIYGASAESVLMGEQTVYVADNVAPLPPAFASIVATPRDQGVELEWSEAAGASTYYVYYGVSAGVYGAYNNVGSETNVVISGLASGSTYYFAISSLDEYNNESAQSPPVTGIPD